MNFCKIVSLITFFVTGFFFPITTWAVDAGYKAGKENVIPDELIQDEKSLDQKITSLALDLQRMHTLRDIANLVVQTPNQTNFSAGKDADGEYIELLAFEEISDTRLDGRRVGTRSKAMRLYFTGNNLSKMKTIVSFKNYEDQSGSYVITTHPAPTQGKHDEIVLSRAFPNVSEAPEGKYAYQQVLRTFDNDPSAPNRSRFKKDFYIPSLIIFEKLFRQTFELQKQGATNSDLLTIRRLKHSLR